MWNVAVESAQARLCLSPPVKTMGRTIVRKGEGISAELTQSPVSRFPWRDNRVFCFLIDGVFTAVLVCPHVVSSPAIPLTAGTRCPGDSTTVLVHDL